MPHLRHALLELLHQLLQPAQLCIHCLLLRVRGTANSLHGAQQPVDVLCSAQQINNIVRQPNQVIFLAALR